jgi:pantetheine-phosphate adenylyltransferase
MKAAVYAGTFDPVTLGHLSVVSRAVELFDRLWIVVAHNPDKQPLFSVTERCQMLREVTAAWPRCSAVSTEGYVVTLARELGARYLVRGVRGGTDIESEIALARLNHQLAPEIETVFVPAHAELAEVSSSRLKQLAREGADLARYCPATVAQRLRELFSTRLSEEPHV